MIEERNGVAYVVEFGDGCEGCFGMGAVYQHAPSCASAFCVGNGDEHSCNGSWLPCLECATMERVG